MSLRTLAARLLAGLLIVFIALGPLGSSWASAQEPRVFFWPDTVGFHRVFANVEAPPDRPARVRFDVEVDYDLSSFNNGCLLIFVLEGDQQNATTNTDNCLTVPAGGGRANWTLRYTPKPELDNVTLFVGLFHVTDAGNTMLSYTVSNPPVSLASVPGRIAFIKAMDARDAGNFALTATFLNEAVAAAPDNGVFAYWRADTMMRLGQYDLALTDFNRALQLMPDDRASLLGRGIARLWKDDYRATINDVTPVINSPEPVDLLTAWAFRARGIAWAGLGYAAPAKADYEAYLRLLPDASDRNLVQRWIDELNVAAGAR